MANLRKENRDLAKQLKTAVETLETVTAQVTKTREGEARQLVDAAGYKGLDISIVLDRVEGDLTAETVTAALQAAGLGVIESVGDESADGETVKAPDVQGAASSVGQAVAQAAKKAGESIDAEIVGTKSREEVTDVMAKHGGLESYV